MARLGSLDIWDPGNPERQQDLQVLCVVGEHGGDRVAEVGAGKPTEVNIQWGHVREATWWQRVMEKFMWWRSIVGDSVAVGGTCNWGTHVLCGLGGLWPTWMWPLVSEKLDSPGLQDCQAQLQNNPPVVAAIISSSIAVRVWGEEGD